MFCNGKSFLPCDSLRPHEEKVKLSRLLIKVNKRGREQSRVLLVTDKAVYNLMPSKNRFQLRNHNIVSIWGDYSKCKRRIRLEAVKWKVALLQNEVFFFLNEIAAVTFSETNSEFALHVPEEYDYRYKSNHREPIKQVLKQVFLQKTGDILVGARLYIFHEVILCVSTHKQELWIM